MEKKNGHDGCSKRRDYIHKTIFTVISGWWLGFPRVILNSSCLLTLKTNPWINCDFIVFDFAREDKSQLQSSILRLTVRENCYPDICPKSDLPSGGAACFPSQFSHGLGQITAFRERLNWKASKVPSDSTFYEYINISSFGGQRGEKLRVLAAGLS